MQCEISIGELIDKLSILEIKKTRINDAEKLIHVNKEYDVFNTCNLVNKYSFLYKLLVHINSCIWDLTNKIKGTDVADANYSRVAASIFEYNDRRFRIKNILNKLECSNLHEQKSYSANNICVNIDSEEDMYNNLDKINYLITIYDIVHVNTEFYDKLIRICNYPCILRTQNNGVDISTIILDHASVYEFPPIVYISSGRLGDFIHQLSVVYEKYTQNGRKGIVYVSNKDWNYPIEKTYAETAEIILAQYYIKNYKIHANESYDIDLSCWRNSPLVFKNTWYEIFKSVYNIEWCTKQYIRISSNIVYSDKIFFHHSKERFNPRVNYKNFLLEYKNIIFITCDKKEYDNFITHTGARLDCIVFDSLFEFYTAIYSCKLFIGNLSSPTAFAQACFKNRITILGNSDGENIEFIGLEAIWPNCKLINNF